MLLNPRTTVLSGGKIDLYDHFLLPHDTESLFRTLEETIEWGQHEIKIFGKSHLIPRRTAFYGDAGINYTYSGQTFATKTWTRDLIILRDKLRDECSLEFNTVLLNMYTDGQHSMGWHSDDEPELGTNPTIASLSLGGLRKFKLKHKKNAELKADINLSDGSLLVMSGELQHHWLHSVPKTTKRVKSRINLTFRSII